MEKEKKTKKINTKYNIYELDKNHGLAKKDRTWGDKSDKIILVEPEHINMCYDFDTIDEALDTINEYGNTYTEYTIIPKIRIID